MAKSIADDIGLHYVYIGNVPGHPSENTYCPECKKPVISRTGYIIRDINISNNCCGFCQTKIAGIWGR